MATLTSPLLRAAAAGLIALGALTAASDARADLKVGVVDANYAVSQTEDGIRAFNTLRKLFEKRQKDVDAKKAELERMRDDIERQGRVLSREAYLRRVEDWQKRMVELQTQFVNYNEELQKKQGELVGPVMKRMIEVIHRVAKKNGFDIVVDKTSALYVRSDLVLTDQVIQMYNGGGGGGGDEPADDKKGDKKDQKGETPPEPPKEAPKAP